MESPSSFCTALRIPIGAWGMCLVAALAVAQAPARADVVQARGARLEGGLGFADGQLAVAGKPVAWKDVLYVIRAQRTRSIRAPEALRMTSGELWFVDLQSLSGKTLKVRFMLSGAREIDLKLVHAIDFLPGLEPPRPEDKVGALHREKGEPIPGSLLWIDSDRLAIDSPLGVLTLDRSGSSRYLFGNKLAPSGDSHEVSLVDGTTLRGKVAPVKGGVEIEHAVLGKLVIPERALRSVLRRVDGAVSLAAIAPRSVKAVPLVASGVAPEVVRYAESGGTPAWPGGLECLRGIRIQPKTTVTYRLPGQGGRKAVLMTTLSPVGRARGDVQVRFAAGGKAILERKLGPEHKSETLALDVPAGADLAVEVDFGPRIAFPCGVMLGDPHVVLR